MFPDRQTIASRVVLDDRSRLPGRFFGRFDDLGNVRAYARTLMPRR